MAQQQAILSNSHRPKSLAALYQATISPNPDSVDPRGWAECSSQDLGRRRHAACFWQISTVVQWLPRARATIKCRPWRLHCRRGPGSAGFGAEHVRAATLDSIRALDADPRLSRARTPRGQPRSSGFEGRRPRIPELDPKSYGFTEADYGPADFHQSTCLGLETATLREIVAPSCGRTYCGTHRCRVHAHSRSGAKSLDSAAHRGDPGEPHGILRSMSKRIDPRTSLTAAEVLRAVPQQEIQPAPSASVSTAARRPCRRWKKILRRGASDRACEEVVVGMPHRGRLNVLANFMGKPFTAIFSEFQGGAAHPEDVGGSGDVKYHLGTSSDRELRSAIRSISP